jgi:hypothetical protein
LGCDGAARLVKFAAAVFFQFARYDAGKKNRIALAAE